jgi:predicted GNAT family acetyltransferase
MTGSVIDNPDQNRFELALDDAVAVAVYRLNGDRVVLVHTEVPEELSGRGIGSTLAQGAFSLIRESGRKAVTQCPFMASWASRHPEYADLVVAG